MRISFSPGKYVPKRMERVRVRREVKRTTVRDFAMDLDAIEAVKKRRLAAGIKPSTWNHDASFLHSFYEEYESRRRRNRNRRGCGCPSATGSTAAAAWEGRRLGEGSAALAW